MNKLYVQNRQKLAWIAKRNEWGPAYKRPVCYPCVVTWIWITDRLLAIGYTYLQDFKTTSHDSSPQ